MHLRALYSFIGLIYTGIVFAQPNMIPNLSFWVSADVGVTLNGAQISQLQDQSGNNNHANQSMVANQPAFLNNIALLNNHPIIRFDGVNDYLDVGTALGKPSDFTIIAMLMTSNNSLDQVPFGSSANPVDGKSSWGVLYNNAGAGNGVLLYQFGDGTSSSLGNTNNQILSNNKYVILSSRYESGNTYTSIYKNGISEAITPIISNAANCSGTPFGFSLGRIGEASSYYWNGDIAEVVIFSRALTLVEHQQVEQYLNDKYAPPVNLGADITLNYGFCPIELQAHKDWFTSYVWSTASTLDSIDVSISGTYSVSVSNIFGYTSSDEVSITFPGNLRPFPGSSITLCSDSSFKWDTGLDHLGYDFLWQDGSTDSVFTITQAGQYYVTVTDTLGATGCSASSYTLNVTMDNFPQTASLGPDVSMCSGNSIVLTTGAGQAQSYAWSTGASTSALVVTATGDYSLTVTDVNGCVAKDTVHVFVAGSAPAPNFSVSVTCEGAPMQFTDLTLPSSGLASWYWDFGDASTSSVPNPTHVYADSGTYVVSLTVTTTAGCSNNFSANVKVYPLPQADFGIPQAYVGGNTTLADQSNGFGYSINTWSWNFDDPLSGPNNLSASQNPVHQFTVNGTYDIKLLVQTVQGCADSVIKPVLVYTTLPTALNGLLLWVSGDGNISLSGNQVGQWKDMSGNLNHANQGIATSQPILVDSVSVLNNHPALRFDGVNDYLDLGIALSKPNDFTIISVLMANNVSLDQVPFGSSSPGIDGVNTWGVLYNNAGVGSGVLIYQFGDGVNTSFGNTNSQILYDSEFCIVNSGYKSGNNFVSIYKNGVSEATSSIVSNANSCSGSPFGFSIGRLGEASSYYWNGDIAEIIIYDTVLTTAQRLQVEQYLSDKYAPPVNLGADVTKTDQCPLKIQAHKDWFTSYLWSTGATSDSITVANSGIYTLTVTNTFGYRSSDTIQVTYPGTFSPFPGNAATLCAGSSINWSTNLSPASSYTFAWSTGASTSAIQITQAGAYSVTVTDQSGCSRMSNTFTVTIDSFPLKASLGPDISMCSGGSISLASGAGQASSYLWSTGATTAAIVISSTGLNSYSVTVQNANGCVARDTILVNVKGTNPIPNFTYSSVCLGQVSTFADGSTVPAPDGIASWSWNFGPATGSGPLVSYTYTAAGTYTVSLTVTSDSGCSASVQKVQSVFATPNAGFSVNTLTPMPCTGSNITFVDGSSISSGSITSWSWNFGDGGTSVLKNPVHSYTAAGTYTVTHVAFSALNCGDTVISTVTVNPSPTASFTADTVCKGNGTSFTDNSSGTLSGWLWNFGDASNSTQQHPMHTYALAGNYNVSLVVTASNGCVNTTSGTVNVNYLPVAAFTSDSVCVNAPLLLTDNSTVQGSTLSAWNWQLGNGDSSSAQNAVVSYTASGTHSVTLTAISAQGCSSAVTHTVMAMPLPVSNFTFTPGYSYPQGTVNFTSLSTGAVTHEWNFGDGTSTSSLSDPTHTYTDTGTFSIMLITQSAFGCLDSFFSQIFIDTRLLDISLNDMLADPSSGLIQITAFLENRGSLDVSTIELSAYLDGGTAIHELCTGVKQPGAAFPYLFSSSFEVLNNRHSVVCVEVKKVNGQQDDVASNNKMCVAITDEFTLLNPFPNPTVGEIWFLFVSPDASHVKAEVIDPQGRVVATPFDEQATKGLNKISFQTLKLEKGVYWVKVSSGDKVATKVFLKE